MLALLVLLVVLLAIGGVLPRLSDGPVVLVWVLLWLPLLGLLFWRRRLARRAWLRVYLRDTSPWSARLRGGVLMLLGQALLAAVFALALLLSLARGIAPSVWVVLILSVPLWSKVWTLAGRGLQRHASPEFLPVTAGRAVVWASGIVLVLGLGIRSLWQPVPDLGEVTLYDTVRHYAAEQDVRSTVLGGLLSVFAVLEGVPHWLAQHWFDGLPGLGLKVIAWMVVLVREWLFVWPLLLLCAAVSHMVYRHEHRHEPGHSGP
ncbi:hypothetical protein B1C78_05970 [Thioalkalivibrio denitrificans]|uniref:Uncharacterized protein n=2 Tax=Thioalkalivibrio denitrificans TaxID=108003 RepID=A0A1V3NKY5_9GAMM|nr:hypothetical protein B1C78_05970 [Thioalkalivibrio denitrificans]